MGPGAPKGEVLVGDVLVEPAVEEHVADGGAHGHQVETEEWEVVIPGGGLGGENIISYLYLSLDWMLVCCF